MKKQHNINIPPLLLLHLFMLFLAFSYVFSSAVAVPTTRILNSFLKDSSLHHFLPQGGVDMKYANEEEMLQVEEGYVIEGRMDIEHNDYPGTGANNHHDPKTPTPISGRD